MGYLQPTDYAAFGLPADTTDDWITVASAFIDSYCKRTSLSPTQYQERVRVPAHRQTARLSYLPLVTIAPNASPLISVKARYTRPRRGDVIDTIELEQIACAFGLPGMWTALNIPDVEFVANTGELTFPYSVLGLPYNEVDVTYTAGLASIPNAVKTACAQIVKNAQTTPGFNVKSSRMDTMQMSYFSNSVIDSQVAALLQPYVAALLG
jgi:Flp pilus assembly protein TadG